MLSRTFSFCAFRVWRHLLAVAAVVLSFAALEARAEVVLDTFAPSDTAPGPGWSLYNIGGSGQSLAVSFSTASAVSVDSILAAVSGTGSVTLGIMGDAAGLPSGSFLHSAVLVNPVANASITGLGWALGAGNYWLAAIGIDAFVGSWTGGIAGVNWAFTSGGGLATGPWIPQFGVDGAEAPAARLVTSVPEPEIYALLLAGLGVLGFAARRRNRASF